MGGERRYPYPKSIKNKANNININTKQDSRHDILYIWASAHCVYMSCSCSSCILLCWVLSIRWVWSPAGGWWCNPYHWRRNTIIISLGAAVVATYLYRLGSINEGYVDLVNQRVTYAQTDGRRIVAERKERRRAREGYERELGQRPVPLLDE